MAQLRVQNARSDLQISCIKYFSAHCCGVIKLITHLTLGARGSGVVLYVKHTALSPIASTKSNEWCSTLGNVSPMEGNSHLRLKAGITELMKWQFFAPY